MKGAIMLSGGSGKIFAAIGAVYPPGSDCVCCNELFAKMVKGKTGTADGKLSDVETHITSGAYIPVAAGVKYTVQAQSIKPGDTAGEHGVVFFKADQSFLSYSSFGADSYVFFNAPAEAAYMKLNFYVKTQPAAMPEDISVLSGERKKVLKAKDDRDKWVFNIPFSGSWTVSAELDGNKVEKTVAITAEGQTETVELAFVLSLFDGGDNTELTGGWGIKQVGGTNGGSLTVGETLSIKCAGESNDYTYGAYVHTKKTIDLTNISAITVKITAAKAEANAWAFGIKKSNTNAADDYDARFTFTEKGEKSLDVSSYSGAYYLYFRTSFSGASGRDNTCSVSSIKAMP